MVLSLVQAGIGVGGPGGGIYFICLITLLYTAEKKLQKIQRIIVLKLESI